MVKTARDEVRDLLEAIPEDASFEDIQYHFYVRQKIERGIDAAREDRTTTHEAIARRSSRWTVE